MLQNFSADTSSRDSFEEQPKIFNDGYLRGFENLGLGLESLNEIGRREVDVGEESGLELDGNEDVEETSERELETMVARERLRRRIGFLLFFPLNKINLVHSFFFLLFFLFFVIFCTSRRSPSILEESETS